jgi:cysteine desulfurase
MASLPIYMDNNATTRVDPRVVEAMLPFFSEHYGNAASRNHGFGWKAEEAVETAREQVARLIGADKREIIFTSGATESNNLALKGVAASARGQGNHIVTVQTEHRAVLDPCRRLQADGCAVTFLPVDAAGVLSADQIADALRGCSTTSPLSPAAGERGRGEGVLKQPLRDGAVLVSVMAANNEIGVLQPVADIGRLCKERGILFHSDATQAVGKVPIDVEAMGIDLLSCSAHKIYGPKGIGALFVRRRNPHVRLAPLMDGGGHERGLRSGTLPVPLIVGFGAACVLAEREMTEESRRLLSLRTRLLQGLVGQLDGCRINGSLEQRLPGNLNVSFAGVHGEALLMSLRNVAISSGSACTSASVEPSYVLRALGVPDDLAHASIRFGLGRFNTEEEVDFVIGEVVQAVRKLRQMNPSAT